jgi:hypothetical protein
MNESDALKWVYAMALADFESASESRPVEQGEALWVVYRILKEDRPIDVPPVTHAASGRLTGIHGKR